MCLYPGVTTHLKEYFERSFVLDFSHDLEYCSSNTPVTNGFAAEFNCVVKKFQVRCVSNVMSID